MAPSRTFSPTARASTRIREARRRTDWSKVPSTRACGFSRCRRPTRSDARPTTLVHVGCGRGDPAVFLSLATRSFPHVHTPVSCPQGRRARRRCDGRADRRSSRQRGRPGRAVRPRGEGRRSRRHREEGAVRSREARAVAARDRRSRRVHRRRELRPRPGATRRMRSRHRSHRRADGLEARSLREDRAASRAASDLRIQHVRVVDQRAGRCATRRRARRVFAESISSIRRATCISSS